VLFKVGAPIYEGRLGKARRRAAASKL